MILICYDGSDDAKAAIDEAGKLFGGHAATVLTVWQPFAEVLAATTLGWGIAPGVLDIEEADEASRTAAQRLAAEGAELARQAGFNAQPRESTQFETVADAILDEAERAEARAIVMGSRGLTGLKSLLLGSVSHAVLQRADRTVIVVPSPAVASSRKRRHTRS
jgi:nucleotide-binding universal stress UspA family protein